MIRSGASSPAATETGRTTRRLAADLGHRRRAHDALALLAGICSLLALLSVAAVIGIGLKTRADQRERLDQTCTLFETDHLRDVKKLRHTYRYLLALRPDERDDTINRFVRRDLPELERDARTDSAPEFCDEPGRGLPEPDPVVPRRPRALR